MGKILWRHPGHLVWILFAYIPWLNEMSIPLTGDQKTYIAIAMEMWERGDWWRPYLFAEPNYLKPPFQYWMTLLSWSVLGFNMLGTLLPSVLATVGTAWFVSEIAGLLGERRWYVSAGLWFAATIGAMTYGTTAQMDIYLCLFYAAAWWAGLKFLADPDGTRQVKWLYIAFLIAGLSSLVKSPLYAVFWVLGYLSYLFISGEWLLFKNRHVYLAWAAGVGAGLIWFVAMAATDGDRFLAQYWGQEQAGKIGGNGGTVWNLWIPLLYMAFPFTLLLIPGVRSIVVGRKTNAITRFVVSWCWPPALFFTLYPYRTSLYLFILVPALAVFADWGCFRASRTRTFKWAARTTGGAMLIALSFASLVLWRAEFIPIWLALALVFAGAAGVVVAWMGWVRVFALCSLAAVLLFRIGAVELARSDLSGLKAALGPIKSHQVAMLDESKNIWHEVGLLSVALGTPMKRLYGLDDLVDHLSRGGTLILSDTDFEKYQYTLDSFLGTRGLEIEYAPWKRFKRRQKFPMKDLILRGRGELPEFDDMISREFKVARLKPALAE